MKKITDTLVRITLFVVLFVVINVFAAFIVKPLPIGDNTGLMMLLANIIAMVLMILGLSLYIKNISPAPKSVMIGRRGLNPIIALWGVIVLVALSVVISPLEGIIPADNRFFDDSVWTLINVVFVAPIFEEIIFRGKLYNILCVNSSPLIAALLSSLIFGIVHFEPIVILSGFLSGMLFSYVYIRTKSIIAPIILHICNNAMAYALTILSYNEQSLLELVNSEAYFFVIYICSVGIVASSMVGIVVRHIREGRRKVSTVGGKA